MSYMYNKRLEKSEKKKLTWLTFSSFSKSRLGPFVLISKIQLQKLSNKLFKNISLLALVYDELTHACSINKEAELEQWLACLR